MNSKEVIEWAEAKGILKYENHPKQYMKFIEEVGEMTECITKNKPAEELAKEIGDVFVTVIILAAQLGLDPETCLDLAYEKIAKRKGKTINGIFVKEEDL